MANQEHVDILKQGVEIWNEWKETNRLLEIDLREADFRKYELRGVNLGYADLSGAVRREVASVIVP